MNEVKCPDCGSSAIYDGFNMYQCRNELCACDFEVQYESADEESETA